MTCKHTDSGFSRFKYLVTGKETWKCFTCGKELTKEEYEEWKVKNKHV